MFPVDHVYDYNPMGYKCQAKSENILKKMNKLYNPDLTQLESRVKSRILMYNPAPVTVLKLNWNEPNEIRGLVW